MNISTKITRVVGALVLLSVGVWSIVGVAAPAAETVTHERAVYSAGHTAHEPGSPSGDTFMVELGGTVQLEPGFGEPSHWMYEKWLSGELDLDEMESRVGPAEKAALQEAAMNMAPGEGKVQQDAPDQNAVTLSSSFDALDATLASGTPPDSDMAAGPSHLIAVENSYFIIYNKAGTALAGADFDTFLSVFSASGTFDPTVLYDSEEDRFVMGIEDGANFFLMVTQTGDPTGVWNLYSFDARYYGDEFFDYPHIGIGDHAIFMGSNMFGGSVPGGFEGRMYAMDKNAAYAGSSLTVTTASGGYDGSTPQPLNLTGYQQGTVPPFNTHYFITDYYDGSTAWLWAWPNALGGGTPRVVRSYNLNSYMGWTAGYPVDVEQLSGSDIQGNDWRFRSFEFRNGYAWTTDTVSYNMGSGTVNIVRWTQIDLMNAGYPIVNGQGFGNASSHYIFPDIAVSHCNDVLLGFEASDSSIYPGVRYTGRMHTDPAGTLEGSVLLKAGEAVYTSFDSVPYRWGDYSGAAIDPDGETFWFMGEYAKNIVNFSTYGNYIGEFTYGSPLYACILNPFAEKWVTAFDQAHGWNNTSYTRTLADVNGDGYDDAVGFGLDGVYVALSDGLGSFGSVSKWVTAFDQAHGWNNNDHVRTLADVNGDGNADAVGFGLDGVYVALSNGSNGFGSVSKWVTAFDQAHGWTNSAHVRTLADVNGDGYADAVGFGMDGIYVALSNSSGFDSATKWSSGAFDSGHGWTVTDHTRLFADVNGDFRFDAVGFGLDGVYVALAK